MIRSYWYLLPCTLLPCTLGAFGSYGTPLMVLGLALGIFFGTVSLRGHRTQSSTTTCSTTTHPGV